MPQIIPVRFKQQLSDFLERRSLEEDLPRRVSRKDIWQRMLLLLTMLRDASLGRQPKLGPKLPGGINLQAPNRENRKSICPEGTAV